MNVTLRCPRTDKVLQIALPEDSRGLSDHWRKTIRFSCPHCSFRHRVKFRAAWTAGVIDQLSPQGPSSDASRPREAAG